MAKRKSLSKKIRFEVFKRDNFTCQYCGSKAPDVILEIDHIKPVIEGGDDSIMNLVTSCFACNRGKGKRELNDQSTIEKQRIQIEELNLRRQQLEMMLEWRDGLKKENELLNNKAVEYFNQLFDDVSLSDSGVKKINKFVKRYGLIKVIDTIDSCFEKYNKDYNDENENAAIVFKRLGSLLYLSDKPEHIKKIAYIKGIVRNQGYINEKVASIELMNFYKKGYSLDDLISKLKTDSFKNWSQFREYITIGEEVNDD